MFDKKRHMYTFRSICIQDKSIELDDGSAKIFLCAGGTMDDVSPDIKAFLDYIKGLPVKDDFVSEIDEYIREVKTNKEERVSYMTFEMKMQEAREEGRVEGEKIADRRTASRLLSKNMSVEEVLEYVNLSKDEVLQLANKN